MAAAILTPLAVQGAAAGIQALGNIGGGKKRAADMYFGALFTDAATAASLLPALREKYPDDQALLFLEMKIAEMQTKAQAGMAIFDKAADPVPR